MASASTSARPTKRARRNAKAKFCCCFSPGANSIHIGLLGEYSRFYLDNERFKVDGTTGLHWNEGLLTAIRMYSSFHAFISSGAPETLEYAQDKVLIALSPLISIVNAAKLCEYHAPLVALDGRLQDGFRMLITAAKLSFQRNASPDEMAAIFACKTVSFLTAIEHMCLPISNTALDEITDFARRRIKCTMDHAGCYFSGIHQSVAALKGKLDQQQQSFPDMYDVSGAARGAGLAEHFPVIEDAAAPGSPFSDESNWLTEGDPLFLSLFCEEEMPSPFSLES